MNIVLMLEQLVLEIGIVLLFTAILCCWVASKKQSATSPRPSPPEAEREKSVPVAGIGLDLFNPKWAEQKRLLLERLANTPANDPLVTGLLALMEQSMLVQVRRCQDLNLGTDEAKAIVNSIGLLVGLRADIEETWKTQLSKKANQG